MKKVLSLEALVTSPVNKAFNREVDKATKSLKDDKDIEGIREITLKVSLLVSKEGFIVFRTSASSKIPKRSHSGIAILNDAGNLEIDTHTDDARQSPLFSEAAQEQIDKERNGKKPNLSIIK